MQLTKLGQQLRRTYVPASQPDVLSKALRVSNSNQQTPYEYGRRVAAPVTKTVQKTVLPDSKQV